MCIIKVMDYQITHRFFLRRVNGDHFDIISTENKVETVVLCLDWLEAGFLYSAIGMALENSPEDREKEG